MDIVIMARDTLPLAAQDPAALKPVPQAVQDDNLVPKGSLSDHRRYVFGAQSKSGCLF